MGNQIIQPKYDVLFDSEYSIQEGIIMAKIANKIGMLNIKGEEIIPFKYASIRYIGDGLLVAAIKSKYGIIGICNHVIVPFIYDDMGNYYAKLMKVKLNGKHGIIDIKGNIIIPIKCTLMTDLIGGFFVNDKSLAEVELEGKYGVISGIGKFVIPNIYDDLLYFNDEFIVVKLNNKYGVIDNQNNIIIHIEYEDLSFTEFDNNLKHIRYNIGEISGTKEIRRKVSL